MSFKSDSASERKPTRRRPSKKQKQVQIPTDQELPDFIAAVIKKQVDTFAAQTFDHFQDYYNKLHIYPSEIAKPMKSQDGSWIGSSRYVFDMYSHDPMEKEARMDGRRRVYVQHAGRWSSLKDFLLKLSPPVSIWDEPREHMSPEEKVQLWEDQWTWWQKTGKKFRLLDLPMEIREIIYGFAVVKTIQPYPRARCRRLLANHASALASRLPNASLFKTKKQVYLEGSHLMYRDATFLIEKRKLLERRLFASGITCSRISKLDLSLSHQEFWRFFGFKRGPGDVAFRTKKAAMMLHSMTLTELTFSIAMPQKFSELEGLGNLCQRIVVDWVLESVWPWVKGHPVKLQGGVKNRQKQEFLEKCEKERDDYLRWCKIKPLRYIEGTLKEYDDELNDWKGQKDGGDRLDGQEIREEPEVIESEKVFPECDCTLKCQSHWTPED